MKKIKNVAVSFIDATHPNNETDLVAAEMARECFKRGYFGESIERFGFLYDDDGKIAFAMFDTSDAAYLGRAEKELEGCATSDVVNARRRIDDPDEELDQAEAWLADRIRLTLEKDFDTAYFEAAAKQHPAGLLTQADMDLIRELNGPQPEETAVRVLSCGAVVQHDYGSKSIVENGCLADFMCSVEKELANGARLLEVYISGVALSNRSVAQAHREAKRALLERSEHFVDHYKPADRPACEGLSPAAARRLSYYAALQA